MEIKTSELFEAHWERQTKGGNQWSTLERLAAKEAFKAGFNAAIKGKQKEGPVRFTCHGNSAPAYSCNKPGDMSGDYYRVPNELEG